MTTPHQADPDEVPRLVAGADVLSLLHFHVPQHRRLVVEEVTYVVTCCCGVEVAAGSEDQVGRDFLAHVALVIAEDVNDTYRRSLATIEDHRPRETTAP